MWACYLWLYDKTKYEPLLVQARTAITETMKRYPDEWSYALHEMQMERGTHDPAAGVAGSRGR